MKFKITYKTSDGETTVIDKNAPEALEEFRQLATPMTREEIDEFFDYQGDAKPDAVVFAYQNPDDPQTTADWQVDWVPKDQDVQSKKYPVPGYIAKHGFGYQQPIQNVELPEPIKKDIYEFHVWEKSAGSLLPGWDFPLSEEEDATTE